MKHITLFVSTILLSTSAMTQPLLEGRKHLENENFFEALRIFNLIAEQEPHNADVYYYIGEVKYAQEQYAEAEQAYLQGLKINANSPLPNIGVGKLFLDRGNQTDAVKYFNTAIRNANKDKAQINGHIGHAYLQSQKPIAEKAIEHLTLARDTDPKVARFWSLLGDAYKLHGDMGKAMTSYEVAVDKDNTDMHAYLSMATIWADSKREELAITNLEQAVTIDPDFAPAYKHLYELYISTRQLDKVIPILEKYTSLTGSDVEARVRLVKFLCFQAKNYTKAIEEGEKLLSTNPEQYTLHRWLAWSYAEVGDAQHSLDHSKKLFDALGEDKTRKVFPSDYEYWARSAFDLDMHDEAAHIYRKYLDLDSTRALEIYGKLAKAYYDAKDYPQAIAYFLRKGTEQQLGGTDQYYLGLSYYYTDAYVQADSLFQEILIKTPEYPQGWMMRARVANQMDPERKEFLSMPFYEKYVEFAVADKVKNKKNLIEACNYLGYYFVQQEDFESAIQYYNMSVELDPANEEATQALVVLNGKK